MATTEKVETYSVLVGQFQDVCPNHNKGSWRSISQVMHNKSEESPHKQNTTSSGRHMFKLDVNIYIWSLGLMFHKNLFHIYCCYLYVYYTSGMSFHCYVADTKFLILTKPDTSLIKIINV